ncbi:phosphopantetheine-binding protein [Amycolatopsis sp. FBCC-B4732]|uniref:phosphopantetheine-binding protein n=1 Tax=Amycolatopsis sp. FBCC-B4732 TaxID=3079339 RepID=UPI001FF30386|nr:phosphopantetheine-binding protein [Amycolatopsis sp. FBCC-B4732]UOX92976.1 phosphopantetheine-binding protein [Amycolatopsis sp. FBCC-B4732]
MGNALAGRTGDALVAALRELVLRQLPATAADLGPDSPLGEAGLTSLRTVATLVAIEAGLGAELPPELITPDTFRSVRTLAAAIEPVAAAAGPARDRV